jgi:hypothetical protein
MAKSSGTKWFGVRTVFLHSGGMYEERIITVAANGLDDAILRGELEGADYAADLGVEQLGLVQAFAMFDDLADGAEVFSLVRQSSLEQETYLTRFFDTGTERQRDVSED